MRGEQWSQWPWDFFYPQGFMEWFQQNQQKWRFHGQKIYQIDGDSKFQTYSTRWVENIRISMLVSVSFPWPKERLVNLLKNERIDSPPWTLLLPVVSRYFQGCVRKSNKIKCDKMMYADFMSHPLAVYNGNPWNSTRHGQVQWVSSSFQNPCWLMIVEGYITQYIRGIVMDYHRKRLNQWTNHHNTHWASKANDVPMVGSNDS